MLTIRARASGSRSSATTLLWAGGALLVVALLLLLRGAAADNEPSAPGKPAATGKRHSAPPFAPTVERVQPRHGAPQRAASPPAVDDEADAARMLVDTDDPAVLAVRAAAADRSDRGTAKLIASLVSTNEVVVAEAANALVARRATQAIAPLSRISLESAAGSGLSIIDALGRLGALADAGGKSVAVERLVAMLAEEKERSARESPGNLLQIYEALGHTRDPSAAPPLEAELLDPTVARAPKVVIVGALVAIGLPRSRAALETAHTQHMKAAAADAFEEEIRQELVGALEQALEGL